jgi:N-acetylglucosaminyl-diphospho-decaprenol L-rhamnosyltransferase
MSAPPQVTAVVPTLGRSPWLVACLTALRRQQGAPPIEIVVVDQAPQPLVLPAGLADRILRPGRNLGFAGGTNLGIAAAAGELIATVNDDALVAPDWLEALLAALAAHPAAAAAQGVNLQAALADPDAAAATATAGGSPDLATRDPAPGAAAGAAAAPRGPAPRRDGGGRERIDGCGLGWNRWWQAIQLGHGELAAAAGPTAAAVEIYGVSATAALFRRAALERVALAGQAFDPRLISYYEDAELAGRLRAAGFRALLVPAARAHHAGSTSGRTGSRQRWRLIYGNRYLAAARLLGRAFWPRLPRLVGRDLLDLAHLLGRPAAGGLDRGRAAGILTGWGRAAGRLPAFAHTGRPPLTPAEIARLSRWPVQPG